MSLHLPKGVGTAGLVRTLASHYVSKLTPLSIIYIYTCIYTYIYIYTYTGIYTYAYMYIYIYSLDPEPHAS